MEYNFLFLTVTLSINVKLERVNIHSISLCEVTLVKFHKQNLLTRLRQHQEILDL